MLMKGFIVPCHVNSMTRLLDVLISGLGLLLGWPLFVLIALIIWFDCGPVFFVQERVGRFQKPFNILKFRSMRPGTASVATHLVSIHSITPFGHLLRRTKLDELPQLWNVLRGEMSLVGPRPCLVNQYQLIAARERLGVFKARPGITGLAQVNQIDMSTPNLLAETDAEMLRSLTIAGYFHYILKTVFGYRTKGRVRS